MYDTTLYEIDSQNQQECSALIKENAVLYRIASLTHWEKDHIISGEAPMITKSTGRFHQVDQRTTYCANNIMVCLSEILYHMYRKALDSIKDNQFTNHTSVWITQKLRLVIFSVSGIDDLIYVDSIGAKTYDSRVISSTIVFPDPIYGPLHDVSDRLRQQGKSGVVYPSARHSMDFAFAFFKNETHRIKDNFYEAPFLKLQLITETQDLSNIPPQRFKTYTDKLHATIGYYEFEDPVHFQNLNSRGLIYPSGIPTAGYIDFVRRLYFTYPRQAYLP